MEKILIIDDDVTFSLMLRTWLGKKGFGVDTAADIAAGRRLLAEGSYDLVLSDMRLPDGDGTDLLQWIAERGVTVPVIVMTGYAEIRNAVVSMKLGARDYVSKPVQPDELLRKIREALDAPHPETAVSASAATAPAPAKPRRKGDRALDEGELNYIEGHSDASRKLYEYVRLVAPTNMSVLLEGASGTGKEHVARLIHLRSKRAGKPFVAVDCGALSRELAASEFFGHIKGSFTGALSDKKGAFESAQGGTLFLDEVGNLSYEVQIQLLRALQERRIKPVGGLREIPVDVRLICATNEDLEAAIARGSFRADLYHRIDEFVLHMPDLAERREDIMLYADFFLDQANRELDKHVVGFDPEAEKLLVACKSAATEERRDPGGSADDGRVRHSGRAARRIVGGCSGADRFARSGGRGRADPAGAGGGRRQQIPGGPAAGDRSQDALQQTASVRHRIVVGCGNIPHHFGDFHTVPQPHIKLSISYIFDYQHNDLCRRIGIHLDDVMNTEVGEPKEKNYFLFEKQSQNEKVIHCSSCNRNGRKHGFLRSENPEGRPGYGRDGTGSDRAGRGCRGRNRNAGIRDSCRCRESENTTGAGK